MKHAVKNFFQSEWAKMRVMNFTEKRQYIWEYYKLHILGLAICIFAASSLINHFFINPPPRDYLYIAWVGEETYLGNLTRIGEALNTIVTDPDRERITVWSYAFTGNPQMDSASQQRFAAMLHSGAIDLFLAPHVAVQELAEATFSRSMDEVLTYAAALNPILYQQMQSQLLTITYTRENGEALTEIMAVSLANTPLFNYLNIDASDIYLIPVITTQNFDRIARALEAIFLWTPQN
ncbi:MAG: hypothetical protein FWG38_01605 [Defluviitaleaceae bacterium]|nr:hypothetical protein [Defluviitaleaceae bacterium]